MKALSFLIWSLWAGIGGRVLLAPAYRLTLSEGLVLLLVCAPAVGLLCGLRLALKATTATEQAKPEAAPPKAVPTQRPPRDTQVRPVQVQVF